MIKLSVIMSCYNAEKFLAKSIQSIIEQTYKNFEFIIINDGSTDKTPEIINYYSSVDDRVIVIHQDNLGLTKALNIGIKLAAGKYIARMDADDISLPSRFEKFIKYVHEKGEINLYSTPAYTINEENEVQKIIPNYLRRFGFNQKMLNYSNSLIHGTLIVNSVILKKYKYNEDYKYSQDFELYHRLMKDGFNISYDNLNISYKLRVHSNSISSLQKSKQFEIFESICKKYNKKYYRNNLVNRVFIKILDAYYFLKIHFFQSEN